LNATVVGEGQVAGQYKSCYKEVVNVIAVDPASPVPPFEQVRTQIAAAIESGELTPATKLPTVRELAANLGLAANTVARVYRELEMAGLIETRGRNGSFVSGAPTQTGRQAARAAADFLRKMRALGIGDAESLAIVRREVEATSVRRA
jgi:DNA-binding transcriptional regulator YhcF (GntR family)